MAFAAMYKDGENVFYYITVMNEPYAMPAMPGNVNGRHPAGDVPLPARQTQSRSCARNCLEAGAILNEALRAQEILETKYCVAADVWSVTSYKELYNDGIESERWNRLPTRAKRRACPTSPSALADAPGVLVAASDYLKTLPNMISKWMPRRLASLGTDGFGRSEGRTALRDFFEVDSRFITLATLHELSWDGKVERSLLDKAIKDLGITSTSPIR